MREIPTWVIWTFLGTGAATFCIWLWDKIRNGGDDDSNGAW